MLISRSPHKKWYNIVGGVVNKNVIKIGPKEERGEKWEKNSISTI